MNCGTRNLCGKFVSLGKVSVGASYRDNFLSMRGSGMSHMIATLT